MNKARSFSVSLFLVSCFLFPASLQAADNRNLPKYGTIQPFSLTERSGSTITLNDLKGKIWMVNFIFTRCSGPCPLLTKNMSHMQKTAPEQVHVLSISVDPDYDTPEILSQYARAQGADTQRWLFITGQKEKVYDLIRNGFHVGVTKDDTAKTPGDAFIHSTRFAVVDSEGSIRGYYDGMDPKNLKKMNRDLKWLVLNTYHPMAVKLPALNAGLNLLSIILLWTGFQWIKRKKVSLHRFFMISAFLASMLFLTSYLTYHHYAGAVPFLKEGWIRPVYFSILISHTILAALIVPMVLITLYSALRKNFEKHKNIARWTLPIWLYVCVTGVLVYWMLYE